MKHSRGGERTVSISAPDAKETARAETFSYPNPLHWPPFWFFILLVLAVSAIGYAAFQHHKADTRQEAMELLSTIADLKVEEITKWRWERKGDAETFAQAPLFLREMEKWLQRGMPPGESRSMILERMDLTRRVYDYQRVFLLDTSGKPVLATSSDISPPNNSMQEAAKEAIRTQNIIFMNIGSRNETGVMGVAAPLLATHDGKPEAIGALYLHIDPSRFLFPLLKAIPLSSQSMEVALVRREGDDVLFLNVNAEGGSLLRQPLSQSKLPAALAVSGMQGEVEGVDYRGVAVFAALRKIPDSGWSLVAKVNQEEIYAPLRKLAWLVAGAIAVLIALTGIAVGFWWRSQRAGFLIEQYRAEAAHQALAQHFDYLTKYANDIILLADNQGRIIEANDRALAEYGYGREALLRLVLGDLRAPASQMEVNTLWRKLVEHENALRFETLHQRSDKTIFPVEVSARLIKVDDKLFYQEIIRDITERKQAEKNIQRLNRLYNVLSRTNKMIVRAQDRHALFDEACRIAVEQGSFRMAWVGMIDETTRLIKPVAMHGNSGDYLKNIRISADDIPEGRGPSGTALREGRHFICKDIEHEPCMAPWREAALAIGYRSSAAFPLRVGGMVKGVYNVYAPEANWFNDEEVRLLDELASDISYALDALEKEELRKQAEKELRAASLYARSLIEASLDPLVTISADGKITDVNKATEHVTGVPRQQMIGSDFSEYFTEPEQARAGYREVFTKELVTDYPLSIRHVSGKVTDVLYNAAVYRDEAGNIQGVFAAARDITERKQAENELREKEERLALATLHNGVGVWDWNLVTQEMIWDDSMFSLYHIRREDFIGTEEAWRAALHPDDLHRGDREVDDAIAGIRPFDTEFRVVWPNGEIHHIKAVAKVFRDEKGTPLRMLGINMDITELRQTAIALQEKTSLLRNIIDSSADYIFAKDRELRTILCNEIFARAVGKSVQDIIGKTDIENGWDPLLVKGDAAKGIKGYEQDDLDAIAGKTVHSVDQLYVGGELHYVDTMKLPLRDDAGHTLGMFGVSRDITERKRAEKALRQSEEALRESQRIAHLGSWNLDVTTNQVVWSDELYKMYELDPALPPPPYTEHQKLFTPESWKLLSTALANTRETGIPYELELETVRKDGSNGWMWVRGEQLHDENGVTIGLRGIALDITERKQAEAEVRLLNAELEQRVIKRTAELEAANKELEAFAYSVSHDLRVPLRAIDGFSRIMLKEYEDKLDDEGKRLLNVVRDNTKRMGQLIDDILAFSRAGRLEIKAAEADMEALAREVWQELEPAIAGREVRLDIKALPKVRGDSAMLRQVWVNLLGNAVKFTNSRATASIEAGSSLAGNEYTFYVKDNGVGFDQQYVGKLFGVFQRLHGVNEFEGTGIGLAIVKRIIARHGGRVWAEGKIDEGAAFYFSLPKK